MVVAAERVDLYDEHGVVVGVATRSRVRAQNLRHGATAVLVRDALGRIYVHRRTTTKDVYPGLLDFAAGGVLQAGEDPHEGALREVEEELGVVGAALTLIGQDNYTDELSTYRAFRYTTTFDGPIRWQPEEVSWGTWLTVAALRRAIEQSPQQFVPDSTALWADLLSAWALDRVELVGGGDSRTVLVENRWVDRGPRHDDTAGGLLAETRLLPAIAAELPLEVPLPQVVERHPLVVRHRLVVGEAADPATLTVSDGQVLGRFLRALHLLPESLAGEHGVGTASHDAEHRAFTVARFRSVVLPMLTPSLADIAEALLDRVQWSTGQRLCHGDLTGEHVLVREGRVCGVIDWGEARVTDPAIDLAWLVHGTNGRFARQLIISYEASRDEVARSALWFALVPWHALSRAVMLSDHAASQRLLHEVHAALRRWSTQA